MKYRYYPLSDVQGYRFTKPQKWQLYQLFFVDYEYFAHY